MIGSYTKLQKEFNLLKSNDISGAVVAIYAHEERVAAKLGLESEFDLLDNVRRVGKFTAKLIELNRHTGVDEDQIN